LEPVAIAIDLLDEEHSLQLALERLAADRPLRARLGTAAREWWQRHHQLEPMADAYLRLLSAAAEAVAPRISLPAHLANDGSGRVRSILSNIGLEQQLGHVLVS